MPDVRKHLSKNLFFSKKTHFSEVHAKNSRFSRAQANKNQVSYFRKAL